MVASRVEGEGYFHIDNESFNDELGKIIFSVGPVFKKIIYTQVRFHLFFLAAIIFELIGLVACYSLLVELSFFSFGLAALFLTIFSYFILRIYFQAQKNEQFEEFLSRYARGCKTIIKYREGIPEHHIALGSAFARLASEFSGLEYTFFFAPKWVPSLETMAENMSVRTFCNDVYRMRESLLSKAVEEHIKLVKCEPTSLDIHAALANAYVTLSSLYLEVKKGQKNLIENAEELETKFRKTAQKAIEEFKILNDYAPNDPWVHAQLAYSYSDLNMPKEEIREYEVILKLRPNDTEILFKLGSLYFEQGRNSDGLRIYEKLKQVNFKKAEGLISFYGAVENQRQEA